VKKSNFFLEFLKQGNNIGSILPSSKYLVKKMIEPVDFSQAKTIVEFGPGTGVITFEILKNMSEDARLIVFEINDEFIEMLRKTPDPRMEIIKDFAENVEIHLHERGIDKVDYVISSIPLAMIPKETEYAILNSVKKILNTAGAFIQYQYSIASLKKLKEIFGDVAIDFTSRNVPPACIFTCKILSLEKNRFRTIRKILSA
jgi:phospholipid N-methyltransferase